MASVRWLWKAVRILRTEAHIPSIVTEDVYIEAGGVIAIRDVEERIAEIFDLYYRSDLSLRRGHGKGGAPEPELLEVMDALATTALWLIEGSSSKSREQFQFIQRILEDERDDLRENSYDRRRAETLVETWRKSMRGESSSD